MYVRENNKEIKKEGERRTFQYASGKEKLRSGFRIVFMILTSDAWNNMNRTLQVVRYGYRINLYFSYESQFLIAADLFRNSSDTH